MQEHVFVRVHNKNVAQCIGVGAQVRVRAWGCVQGESCD